MHPTCPHRTNWRAAILFHANRARKRDECDRRIAHARRKQNERKISNLKHDNMTAGPYRHRRICEEKPNVTTRPDCRPASKTTRIASVAASALLAACMLGACADKSGAQSQAKKSVPTVPVLTGQVVEKSMPLRLHAIGNVETVASVAIKSRVDGQIIVTHVRDGQDLVKGDPLFQIDQKPYQSQLEQAQANLARDEAQLEYLRGQEQRYQDLLKQNFVSKEGYAQVAANFHGAQASVTADEAAVQNARINLGYTMIRSPINGRAGKVMLSEGNMVKANDTVAMVVINQLTPIYVSVGVPEQFLNEIRARQKSAPLRVQVELEKGKAIGGKLAFVDNSVDVATGTIKLRGIFSNDDKQLWPGQFVESWVTLRDEEKAVVVPTQALQTGLVMIGILAFGIVSYRLLPVSDLPNVDFPTIAVTSSLPGASPETMASAVATPLEKEFSTIAGLDSMDSTNAQGVSRITLQFSLDRNIDAAAADVQAAITRALKQLPPQMPTPPAFQKVNPADAPIFYLALTSKTLPMSTVDEYAQTLLAQRISTISGVAQVQVIGSQKYAVHVQLDPKALASRGIGIDEVSDAINRHNTNLPTGTLYGSQRAYTVESNGQLMNAAAFRPVVIAYRNGAPVRLSEIGRVIDSVENDKLAAWLNDERGIVLAIQRQPGTNTIEIVNSIKRLLPTFRAQSPAGLRMEILYDRSDSVRESVDDVQFTLMLALALVVLVIFLFLRNISATLIPSLALPMSIVGTFSVMYLFGYSLDNLSLMARTLCVGFVVDDAIVMLENISRHMEMGKPPMQATLEGAREVGFTIVSMTLSLAAVFIPVLFMGGILGKLLHDFAVTIMAAVLASGFDSMSLAPMPFSRMLK